MLNILHAAASQPGLPIDDRNFVFNASIFNSQLDEVKKLVGGRLLSLNENGAILADGLSTSDYPPLGFIIDDAGGFPVFYNKPAVASKFVPFVPLTNGSVVETDQFRDGNYPQGNPVFCGTGDDSGFIVSGLSTGTRASAVITTHLTVNFNDRSRVGNSYTIRVTRDDDRVSVGEVEIELIGRDYTIWIHGLSTTSRLVRDAIDDRNDLIAVWGGTAAQLNSVNVIQPSPNPRISFTGGEDGGPIVGVVEEQPNPNLIRIHLLGS